MEALRTIFGVKKGESIRKQDIESRKLWLFWGVVPTFLLATSYIFLDFYASSGSLRQRAILFLIGGCVATLVACFAAFKVSGWRRAVPLLGAATGIIISLWFLFVATFMITF